MEIRMGEEVGVGSDFAAGKRGGKGRLGLEFFEF